MSDLIAIVYPSEAKAEDVRQRSLKMQIGAPDQDQQCRDRRENGSRAR
jgi:hypothetical protein